MSDYTILQTSAEVWAVIYARHRDDMAPFGSFSDPDGTFNGGPGEIGRMETTYGIKGADYPLMKIRTTWDIVDGKDGPRKHEYWLCVPLKED